MEITGLQFDANRLADVCRRHRVLSLRVFGSFARGSASPDSDVDVLVEFQPDANPQVGLFELAALQQDLNCVFSREVDLKEVANFRPERRPEILKTSILAYAA